MTEEIAEAFIKYLDASEKGRKRRRRRLRNIDCEVPGVEQPNSSNLWG